MARIHTSRQNETVRVTLSGRLSAADMGRFEHACAPALIKHPVALEIDLRGVTSIDQSAAAILDRMADRGARIVQGCSTTSGSAGGSHP
jgi:anti-anti-sigma regulatory factor